MQQKDTDTALNEAHAILTELMATEGHDKFMHLRLAVSLKMINAMIKARDAGRAACRDIKLRCAQKSR